MSGTFTESRDLARAYEECARIVRRRARNFYYGLRLTPEPKRSAIYSVYAWMRRADDEADAEGDARCRLERLRAFGEMTERMFACDNLGGAGSDPVWVAFGETVRRYDIDHACLRDMLAGLETDLVSEGAVRVAQVCATRDDLSRYCYRVASTVGLVCLRVWGLASGVNEEEARRLAVIRGRAFQLTNILRDYAQDFDKGRVYLPAEDFRALSLCPSELRAWSSPQRCEEMVRSIAGWAREEYEASSPLDRMIDPSCFAALRAMTGIYSGLLHLVERDPARIAGRRRIRLQSVRKAGIALRAWLDSRTPAKG